VGISWDKKLLISAAMDGTIHCRAFDFTNVKRLYDGALHVDFEIPTIEGELMLMDPVEDCEDILDDKIYSI